MKKIWAVAAVVMLTLIFCGCDEKKGGKAPAKGAAPARGAAPAQMSGNPAPARAPSAVRQVKSEAAGVVNYATGAQAVQIGARAKQKIQNVSAQRNRDLEDALK